ncbi:MAG: glycosyltransferase family 2 protein [Deltaproteobacteria bacterium]
MSESSHADRALISVVVPLYNEEENVRPLVERLDHVFKEIGCGWALVFALDPSPDQTRQRILELLDRGYPIRLITFSRRIGKPLSLLAGLDHARGDACVIIDADLQDPPELIAEMVEKWRQGYKVVIAQRVSRRGENYFYLKCAQLFYWLVERISEVQIPSISTAVIPFDRDPRFTGKTQISFMGAVNIALDGIIPFSRAPLRLMFVLGLVYIFLAKGTGIAWLIYRIATGFSSNWPIIVLCLILVGAAGLIVACLGVLGEYVVRAYEEARNRPLYIVDEIIESKALSSKPLQGGNRSVDYPER